MTTQCCLSLSLAAVTGLQLHATAGAACHAKDMLFWCYAADTIKQETDVDL